MNEYTILETRHYRHNIEANTIEEAWEDYCSFQDSSEANELYMEDKENYILDYKNDKMINSKDIEAMIRRRYIAEGTAKEILQQ